MYKCRIPSKLKDDPLGRSTLTLTAEKWLAENLRKRKNSMKMQKNKKLPKRKSGQWNMKIIRSGDIINIRLGGI